MIVHQINHIIVDYEGSYTHHNRYFGGYFVAILDFYKHVITYIESLYINDVMRYLLDPKTYDFAPNHTLNIKEI